MTPREFAAHYLPEFWAERDLQLLIQKRISAWGFLKCPSEVGIDTSSTTRRSDLETWWCRYELKKELNYENLKSALGQLYLYNHYGSKILGLIPKRKYIIGLAPADWEHYQKAAKLAIDIRGMGIKVIFLNECPDWHSSNLKGWQIKALLVSSLGLLSFAIAVLATAR